MDKGLNLRSPWPAVKERLKENDISLTDQDLDYQPGRESDLIDRLSRKTNKSPEQIRDYLESISENEDKAG
jgi:hypothetical protein